MPKTVEVYRTAAGWWCVAADRVGFLGSCPMTSDEAMQEAHQRYPDHAITIAKEAAHGTP